MVANDRRAAITAMAEEVDRAGLAVASMRDEVTQLHERWHRLGGDGVGLARDALVHLADVDADLAHAVDTLQFAAASMLRFGSSI